MAYISAAGTPDVGNLQTAILLTRGRSVNMTFSVSVAYQTVNPFSRCLAKRRISSRPSTIKGDSAEQRKEVLPSIKSP
jgi:hypothetical protein